MDYYSMQYNYCIKFMSSSIKLIKVLCKYSTKVTKMY